MEDLSRYPDRDEMYNNCPPFRLLVDSHNAGERVDLDAVWDAAGRQKNKSPRRWYSHAKGRLEPGDVMEVGTGKKTKLMANWNGAIYYMMTFVPMVMTYSYRCFIETIRKDPVGQLAESPSWITAIFCKSVLRERGTDERTSDRILIKGAVEATRGRDEYEREEVVAKVQRAIATEKTIRRVGP